MNRKALDPISRRTVVAIEDNLYQVDLVVSLFAVLIVLLLVGAAVAASREVATPTKEIYKPDDPESLHFNLKSLYLLRPLSDYWLVKDKSLYKLNLEFFARELMDSTAPRGLSATYNTVDIIARAEQDNDPTSFSFQIKFIEKTIPAFLIAETISLDAKDTQQRLIKSSYEQGYTASFFVWREDFEELAGLLAGLRAQGLRYRVEFAEDNKERFRLSRKSSLFETKRILR